MTDRPPGGKASADLCPYLTDVDGGTVGVQSDATADELCPPLTDMGETTAVARPQLAGTRRTHAAMTSRRINTAAALQTARPWARPYVLTGGRTHASQYLLVHTLVSVLNYSPSFAAQLSPEARSLYERAHTHAESVAELSAHCGIPLGVTRVLLSDLLAGSHVRISPDPHASPYDPDLLERIIDGLQQFV
jgi:hypothetical protein